MARTFGSDYLCRFKEPSRPAADTATCKIHLYVHLRSYLTRLRSMRLSTAIPENPLCEQTVLPTSGSSRKWELDGRGSALSRRSPPVNHLVLRTPLAWMIHFDVSRVATTTKTGKCLPRTGILGVPIGADSATPIEILPLRESTRAVEESGIRTRG